MSRREALEAQKRALAPDIAEVRRVIQKARDENRGLTAEENRTAEALLAKVRPINEALDELDRDDKIMAMAKDLSNQVGDVGDDTQPREFKDGGKRLAFGSKMAAKAVRAMRGGDGLGNFAVDGAKALAPSRDTIVGQDFTDKPIELGKVGTTFLDALPVDPRSTPSWKYLRQTVRTNNAAVVAEGAVKPISVYSLVEVDGSLKVIAHLSEAVPRYWLIDNSNLEDFLASELQYGLQLAVEAKVLTDVNATSGIQLQAFDTDVFATLRKAASKIEAVGYAPAYHLLHPTDWEALELEKDLNGQYRLGGPNSLGTRRLWDVPVIVSLAQTAGVSHTVAAETLSVVTDTTGVAVQWSETSNADDFSKNLIRARCEGRFETEVWRPWGVVKGDLTE